MGINHITKISGIFRNQTYFHNADGKLLLHVGCPIWLLNAPLSNSFVASQVVQDSFHQPDYEHNILESKNHFTLAKRENLYGLHRQSHICVIHAFHPLTTKWIPN